MPKWSSTFVALPAVTTVALDPNGNVATLPTATEGVAPLGR